MSTTTENKPQKQGRRPVKATKGVYLRGAIYWIRYADASGQMVLESSKQKLKSKAEELYINRKNAVLQKLMPEMAQPTEYTFTDFCDLKYLPLVADQAGIKVKTYVINQLKVAYGRFKLDQVTTEDVEAYRLRQKARGLATSTMNKHIAAVKHIYSTAKHLDIIDQNCYDKIKKVKKEKENNVKINFLERDEIPLVMRAAEAFPEIRELLIIGINTGIRKSRIFHLEWEHIDFRRSIIKVPRDKTGEVYNAQMNAATIQLLKEREKTKEDGAVYVFSNPDTGKPWVDIRGTLAAIMNAAGLAAKKFTYHDCRHTFISHLIMSGVDVVTVQRLAGHKTIQMTLRYTHLEPKHVTIAINRLNFDMLPVEPVQPVEPAEPVPEQ